MLPSILCFANSRDHAGQIVDRLQADNMSLSDISVLVQPLGGPQPEPVEGLGAGPSVDTDEKTQAGTATGGVVSAGVAVAGSVGFTPLLIVAPVVVGIGAAVGAAMGATATAANGGLAGYGIAPSRMGYYQQRMQQGAYLVAFRTEDEAVMDRAKTLFEQGGGQEIEIFRLTKKLT